MMSETFEYPKMLYKKYPVYAIAKTAQEAEELQKKGYGVERWEPEKMTPDNPTEKPNEPNRK